eukprot:395657-Pleurochrysis_carterae.AAC.1
MPPRQTEINNLACEPPQALISLNSMMHNCTRGRLSTCEYKDIQVPSCRARRTESALKRVVAAAR